MRCPLPDFARKSVLPSPSFAACAALVIALVSAFTARAQQAGDLLRNGFDDPPQVAKPRVWWHWMNGNVTREGIRLDLEWMQRAGIGGFQTFDAGFLTPKVVETPILYMTPEWKDIFRYATGLAGQMHFEEGIAGSPGWSESGGPWVPPSEGMKKYVWSELEVHGGMPFAGKLPHPPTVTGEFQGMVAPPGLLSASFKTEDYYADSAVLAYRMPTSEAMQTPEVSSSDSVDLAMLSDGDLNKYTILTLPAKAGDKAWIQYTFVQPQTLRAVTILSGKRSPFDAVSSGAVSDGVAFESSQDGQHFTRIVDIPKGGTLVHTMSFSPVTAKYFRVTFAKQASAANPPATAGVGSAPSASSVSLAEIVLHAGARVNRFEDKAAFAPLGNLYQFPSPAFTSEEAIRKADVVDLTGRMRADGTLDWTPPAGDWVVLRLGYSLLGVTNHPATKEATGLEVDKLNRTFVKRYMDKYLETYEQTVGPGPLGTRGIQNMVNDSWEAGAQNWTDNMLAEFQKRRGYDPRPWLPVLAGHIVESGAASDGFLWDFRKTIQDLVADEHYGQIEASLKNRGMVHYGESHEDGRTIIADGMEVKKLDDVPMGAIWASMPGDTKQLNYNADDRESSSVAHLYGQNLAAAESLTSCDQASAYMWSPATLKPTVDQEFLNGINRLMIHDSAHQALIGKVPGISLGPCGQWFHRNETWAEQADVWTKYIARSSWMLQQGRNVADILYFYGEDSNLTAIFHSSAPSIPAGYNFDYINADALMHAVSMKAGVLTSLGGTSYRLIYLDKNSRFMSLPVLRALHTLVAQGAVVAGDMPVGTPSLADDQAEFARLRSDLFGKGNSTVSFGKGKVFAGKSALDALQESAVRPDFAASSEENASAVQFAHRKLPDGEVYFLDNRSAHEVSLQGVFRVTGKAPELWFADTGQVTRPSFRAVPTGTAVSVRLEAWGTTFVVFRKPSSTAKYDAPTTVQTRLAAVDGAWDIAFQPDRGAPATAHFDRLSSWSDSSDPGIRYFSGAGTYNTTIDAPASWFGKAARLWIELGDVRNLAVVTVNGQQLPTAWHAPYRVDATEALKPGTNRISVKVYNAWVNRLIGDAQPDAKQRYTFTTWKSYTAKSPLLPSGLLGPVTIEQESMQ